MQSVPKKLLAKNPQRSVVAIFLLDLEPIFSNLSFLVWFQEKKNLKSFILQLRKGFEIFCITLNVAQNKLDYLWLSNIKLFPFTCGAPFLLV